MLTSRVSFRAKSMVALWREKSKLERVCCSDVTFTSASAGVLKTRGSRNVNTVRYSKNELCGWSDTLEKKLTDRFLPKTFRRPMSKKARGANSTSSVGAAFGPL